MKTEHIVHNFFKVNNLKITKKFQQESVAASSKRDFYIKNKVRAFFFYSIQIKVKTCRKETHLMLLFLKMIGLMILALFLEKRSRLSMITYFQELEKSTKAST